jgi:hypothetical protein
MRHLDLKSAPEENAKAAGTMLAKEFFAHARPPAAAKNVKYFKPLATRRGSEKIWQSPLEAAKGKTTSFPSGGEPGL